MAQIHPASSIMDDTEEEGMFETRVDGGGTGSAMDGSRVGEMKEGRGEIGVVVGVEEGVGVGALNIIGVASSAAKLSLSTSSLVDRTLIHLWDGKILGITPFVGLLLMDGSIFCG